MGSILSSQTTLNRTLPMISNNQVQVIPLRYDLIIGFEVNYYDDRRAYNQETNTQNLDMHTGGDYGHAFFFTVQRGKVVTFFSFGPAGSAGRLDSKIGLSMEGHRPGTTEYGIGEVSRLFRFKIDKTQLYKIKTLSKDFNAKVESGEEEFTTYMNDTCSESAKDILDAAEVKTPDGKGYVRTPNSFANIASTRLKFVNPYSWYHQFRTEKGYGEGKIYRPLILQDGIHLREPWILKTGRNAPAIVHIMEYADDLSS